MDSINRNLINMLQGGFPISQSPYQEIANRVGISEDELLWRLEVMKTDGIYSRFGPLYNAEALGGAVTLAALAVPEKEYEQITELVNAHEEVAHNYLRTHHHTPTLFNMWFVISTETREEIDTVIEQIETETGLKVHNMPKQKEYFLELKFTL
ncbi:MAG: Lrp/AsnC family transcriptional regulator [Gammaproteobacteria bacterium]|nr:Lrp/AsnC family transcriptional regulator [Gammaproteobacteria bacterium]MBT3488652.1 Lrp/AsnC family transcriptional regulator [Gammaproteobacteria bacterium]MBT3719662.1 Lrp/AsnC family transcriptional regulator [Gammaproteobacteria bacterium]MBT3844307.1 Lrp/AsnC family transcriptional regulator [Gammaproteobacteria bacterium]MBT3891912.1 Lrp/AsnC family transcriptional regulator [Gammaproteobacteria bacterium]